MEKVEQKFGKVKTRFSNFSMFFEKHIFLRKTGNTAISYPFNYEQLVPSIKRRNFCILKYQKVNRFLGILSTPSGSW